MKMSDDCLKCSSAGRVRAGLRYCTGRKRSMITFRPAYVPRGEPAARPLSRDLGVDGGGVVAPERIGVTLLIFAGYVSTPKSGAVAVRSSARLGDR